MIAEDIRSQGMFPTKHTEVSGVQAQKLQRIRVNRVAIVQVLRVEHVLPHLLKNNIISEEEKAEIVAFKKSEDRARALISLLPEKGRSIDWYRHFRESLRNPDTKSKEIKKKYQILVDFLENTILPSRDPPDGVKDKFPRYETLPEIRSAGSSAKDRAVTFVVENGQDERVLDGESKEEASAAAEAKNEAAKQQQKLLLKGFFHKWINPPEDFTSLIQEPKEHLERLRQSSDVSDQQLLAAEEKALKRIRDLEVVLVLHRRDMLPEGFEVCMSSAAEEFISETSLFHLYFKYFQELSSKHNLNVPLLLAVSFHQLIDNLSDVSDEEARTYIVKVGFGLFRLCADFSMNRRAEDIMTKLVVYLSGCEEIDAWMATYEAFVKLMTIRNANVNFTEADAVYFAAQQMADKIKLMSFGKELLDESELYVGMSTMMREQGSIGSSYRWAQEALKEVAVDNHEGVLNVLCNASLAYGNKLSVKKAEELVVQAVRYAKLYFGVYSPQYVKALLHYCHYSSEYRQDDMGVTVARRALEICSAIYGSGSSTAVQTADAWSALATALTVHRQLADGEHHQAALTAWRASMDVLEGSHPRLAPYRLTLAQSLLWRATSTSDPAQQTSLLIWAETEASGARASFQANWGDTSLKLTQANALLGQIRARLGRYDDAEAILTENLALHRIAYPRGSHYTQLARATLGAFFREAERPIEAVAHLKDVVDNVDCQGVYLAWVHVCYDTLIDLLSAIDQKKQAEVYQGALVDWMHRNPKSGRPLTWDLLDSEPEPYAEFCQRFNTWGTRLKGAKRGVKLLRREMDQGNGDK